MNLFVTLRVLKLFIILREIILNNYIPRTHNFKVSIHSTVYIMELYNNPV